MGSLEAVHVDVRAATRDGPREQARLRFQTVREAIT